MKNLFKQKGFTLIELIVVVAILSILSIAALTALNPLAQFQKANDARRKADLAQIQRALEVYYDDNGRYPSNVNFYDLEIRALSGDRVSWGTSWAPYMEVLPKDPSSGKHYAYYSQGGQSYYIYASLDRDTDPAACNGGQACTSLGTLGLPGNSCGGICNFAVSSPNVNP